MTTLGTLRVVQRDKAVPPLSPSPLYSCRPGHTRSKRTGRRQVLASRGGIQKLSAHVESPFDGQAVRRHLSRTDISELLLTFSAAQKRQQEQVDQNIDHRSEDDHESETLGRRKAGKREDGKTRGNDDI